MRKISFSKVEHIQIQNRLFILLQVRLLNGYVLFSLCPTCDVSMTKKFPRGGLIKTFTATGWNHTATAGWEVQLSTPQLCDFNLRCLMHYGNYLVLKCFNVLFGRHALENCFPYYYISFWFVPKIHFNEPQRIGLNLLQSSDVGECKHWSESNNTARQGLFS